MKNKEYFEKLLKNFRIPEAMGYVVSLMYMDKLSVERGKDCENLLHAYKNVVSNSLWDKEGLLILESIEISEKDVLEERDRLCNIIRDWIQTEKRQLLLYVSAYYALTNEDRLRLKVNLDDIWEHIIKEKTINIPGPIGGYEKFQFVGDELVKYCGLNDSIFNVIQELCINIEIM
ncbi:hypothetical protein EBB54_12155 [Schaedlerella arabinosiphila]|jgi:hypothetical protein|uniref:Uncharacterized protein n=1 Tax=Schaedlerella arabinosiphila TaxID=2044587 RepID=A0A426DGS6_9FIRM|nr:hypothetical protein [Schaedlerella arabinosiphila]RRK32040.1 hypothetical protein EBB54_12155 [Schaedlerella arabinosiphila]